MPTKIIVGCGALLVLTGGLLLGFDTQVGRRNVTEPAQDARAEVPVQDADASLLADVERFAASGGGVSDKTWKRISSYPREDLVGRLNRISAALPEHDRRRVLIAFLLCNLDQDYPLNKKIVISGLAPKPQYRQFYGDWAAGLVIRLIQRGDRSLLPHLFTAAEWSDGAMTEELAGFFVEEIRAEPATFLADLKTVPPRDRREVYTVIDASIFSDRDRKEIRGLLRSAAKNSDIAPVAREMLRALSSSSPQ